MTYILIYTYMAVNGGPNTAESGVVLSIDGANFKSTNYEENIVTDGLVFYVNSSNPKSNGPLSAKDLVSGNIGTLNGGMTVEGTDWTFDGVDEYMDFGDILSFGSDNFTIEVWLKTSDISSGYKSVIGKFAGSTGVFINLNNDTSTKNLLFGWNGSNFATSNISINDGNWHHVIFKRTSDTNCTIIVDDSSSYSGTSASGTADVSAKLLVGDLEGFNRYFNGEIPVVRVYNRDLTTDEITQNYNAGRLALLTEPINELSYVGNGGTYVNNKNAFRFDGVNDYIDFGDIDFDVTSPYSLSIWLKHTTSSNLVILEKGTNDEIALQTLGTGFRWAGTVFDTTGIYNDNEWHHVVLTTDVSNAYIYIDGVLNISGASKIQGSSNSDNFYIGGRASNFGYPGQISNVKIYNRALTAQEILQNYNALRQRYVRRDPFVTDGLVFNVDAGDDDSYPGTGTNWYNLEDLSVVGSLVGSPPFNPNDGGLLTFDGTGDYVNFGDLSLVNFNNTDTFSVEVWANPDPNDDYGTVVSKILVSAPFTGWLVDFDTLTDVVRFQFVSNFGTSNYLSLS